MENNRIKNLLVILFIGVVLTASLNILGQNHEKVNIGNTPIEFLISDFISHTSKQVTIVGTPKIIDSPYGKAVLFDGVDDGIFLDYTPLLGMPNFTVEVIMRPDTDGLKEQRFLHLGELNGERIMLETRLTEDGFWYVDGFVSSGDEKLILIDPTKLHPLNEWYNVAMVNNNGSVEVLINGKTELKGALTFNPFKKGKSSIGVRQNSVYWYKGAIYKIKITPEALKPEDLLSIKNK